MSKQTMFYMKKCAPIFSMLQDERRQEITQLLFENRELSVTALTEKLSLSRSGSLPSSEAAAGYGTGNGRQEGKERYYRMNLRPALTYLKNLTDSIESDIKQME